MRALLTIRETAEKRGIDTPYKLQRAAGLSPTNAVKLFKGTASMVSLTTLAKLCCALDCTPNEIFDCQAKVEEK